MQPWTFWTTVGSIGLDTIHRLDSSGLLGSNCLIQKQPSSFSIQQGTVSLSTKPNYMVNQSMNNTQLLGWFMAHKENDGLT
jgi:hypothetical protein